MKIILVSTAYPLRGGVAHYNAVLVQHLKTRHQVDVITFKRQYPKLLFPGKSQEETGAPSIPMETKPLVDSINPFNWIRVGLIVRRQRPDLLIFRYWLPFFAPCFGTIAAIAKWRTKTKVLFIIDNVVPHERRPGDQMLTRFAFHFADAFIVQSDQVERDLLQLKPDAYYRKVPHPIHEIFGSPIPQTESRQKLGIPVDRPTILFFGYIRPYKGLMTLLDSLPLVASEMDFTALIAGEFYEDERPYREKIRSLGLGDRIRLIPEYVPVEDVALYFSAADVVVLPYLSATQSGIVQIAYKFDKPVIATNVGGLPEVVIHQQTGLIVPPNDPMALAKAIIEFFHEGQISEYVPNIREEKKKYSWERMVQAIEELVMSKQ
jgi:glycosyltransferase involved in cell wall biosynthesis